MIKLLLTSLIFFSFISQGNSQSLYSATGKASFYGKKFENRKTANGEKFSNKNFTAAHRTLPFGTMVRVTNLTNNKSVIVRINDRGPYAKGRIIDLSQAAADSLDFKHSGWANVKVEELPSVDTTAVALEILNDDEPAFRFPADWIGDWKGELKIYSSQGLKKIIPMELHIRPTESPADFSWTIFYDSSARNYELSVLDSSNKYFAINEKNGILIMSSSLGNQFISRFEVEGNLLECVYEMKSHDEISMQIRSGDHDHTWTTGDIQLATDSIPQVKVYKVNVLQKAVLHRIN